MPCSACRLVGGICMLREKEMEDKKPEPSDIKDLLANAIISIESQCENVLEKALSCIHSLEAENKRLKEENERLRSVTELCCNNELKNKEKNNE